MTKVLNQRGFYRDFFPNAGDEAHFDFHSCTIHLKRISRTTLDYDLSTQRLPALREAYSIMLHEMTHWADFVGTLWGREYLRRLFEVRRLVDAGGPTYGPAEKFHLFADLHDRTRRINMGRFYRTQHESRPHGREVPWQLQLSAGQEFGLDGKLEARRPVLFTRLYDNSGSSLVARQPIVVGALLECCAVWSEIATSLEFMRKMSPEERVVEQRLFEVDTGKRLYDPDQTLYTAPAHILANQARIGDPIEGYRLASALANIVLNLDERNFRRLRAPAEFKTWSNLFEGFRQSHNRGFAFAVLCYRGGALSGRSDREWIDAALASAGLESAENILARARAKMSSDSVSDPETPIGRAEAYLLELGVQMFDLRAKGDVSLTPGRLVTANLPTPPMFDLEGETIQLAPATFDTGRFDPEANFYAAAGLSTKTEDFLASCR